MKSTIRDLQAKKAYVWEDRIIIQDRVQFANVKSIVDYVWLGEGLSHPPLVELLPTNCTKKCGDATRLVVRFKPVTSTWIILHEVAHAMTTLPDGNGNYHGSLWLGVYIKLLNKYLNIPLETLASSAMLAGLKFNLDAVPLGE